VKKFQCEICGNWFPEAIGHDHHKVPKALGGSDSPGNIARLCNGDHQNLHIIAHMMLNPKRSHEVEPTVHALHPDNPQGRQKLFDFSRLVAREMALKKEKRKPPEQAGRTVLDLPNRYLELLRLWGHDMPSQTGRSAGVSRVLRRIIADALVKKFPAHRDEILRLYSNPVKESNEP
jgi:hypothetical protein